MLRIAHLHDAQAACDVSRYLGFLGENALLGATASHRAVAVPRYAAGAARLAADVIVSHLPLSVKSLPGLAALRARHPRATLVHVEHIHCEGTTVTARHRGHRRTVLRTGYALFDHVIALSPAQADWMRRHALVAAGQLSVIPTFAQLDAFAALAAPEGPVRRIGAIGALTRQSGFDILIEAFGFVSDPDARLDIYGDGPWRAELRAMARSDTRVRLHGRSTRLAALRPSDAIAMPSRWQPSALAAHEARAAGRRLLHSGRDGLAEVSGRGSVMVSDMSVAAWSRALSDVLAEPAPAPRASLEAPCEATVQGWQALLDRLASQPRSSSSTFATI
ncbi:glycosyltransferase [Salipiger sp. H15]|uniref:Glycosyltransferase n=1 Tax=Alloyangia sp. H15 TaxID=3029062 RepID=A0AAU8AIY1_9RHOB